MNTFESELYDILHTLYMQGEDAGRNNWEGYNSAYERLERDAKQAITSLIKELVAEAKPEHELIITVVNKVRNNTIDEFERNLLKALEDDTHRKGDR